VAEIVLDRPRVLAVVGKLVTAAMPKHVAVDEEREKPAVLPARATMR
jgi:hypothetical protein